LNEPLQFDQKSLDRQPNQLTYSCHNAAYPHPIMLTADRSSVRLSQKCFHRFFPLSVMIWTDTIFYQGLKLGIAKRIAIRDNLESQ
jgi:hypothetical protein